MEKEYDQRIIEMLEKATQSMDVEKIRIEAGIGNWNTALKHCLQLLIEKKINGERTSKSWVFWIEKEIPGNTIQSAPTVEEAAKQ